MRQIGRKNNRGFSLVEVLVTIFIFAVGMLAVLGLVTTSLKGFTNSKMKLIASGLASEGVEIVRNIRSLNVDWDNWYSTVPNGDFRVEYQSGDSVLLAYANIPLKLDSATGLYRYAACATCANSPFYRRVSLTKVSASEVKVSVEVRWLLKGQWYSLTAENRLWNWR